MTVRRFISRLLSCLLLLCFIMSSAYAEETGEEAYPALVTASDFQGGDGAYSNFDEMLGEMALSGHGIPDGFLFGGDYGDEMDTDAAASEARLMTLLNARYGSYSRENVVIVRGNHDGEGSGLDVTGLRTFDDYLVYTIDYADFPDGQYWRANAAAKVKQTAQVLKDCLTELAEAGERRPVFVLSHIPLHHSGRALYGENLYSQYVFDVLNGMGDRLDLVFLFGHDHSGDYDNYIGGSVNLLRRGDSIRIPGPHTGYQGEAGYSNQTLRFTYANYGYVGYANNSLNDVSTNALTAGLWEIRPTEIRLYRYGRDGLYSCQRIDRTRSPIDAPYVDLEGDLSLSQGEICTLRATVRNFEQAEYSWTVKDPSVAEVSYTDDQAQLICRNPGTTELCLTVSDGTTTKSDSLRITVAPADHLTPGIALSYEGRPVNNRTLWFYDVKPGQELYLELSALLPAVEGYCWHSSDPSVATVENGVVRICAGGETVIGFSAEDAANAPQLKLILSEKPKPTFVLEEVSGQLRANMDGTPLTGWHSLLDEDGSVRSYYFAPDSGNAVDGDVEIDGHSYIFRNRVLIRGDLCTDEQGSRYYWAGALVKNRWFSLDEKRYYAMSDGCLATGLQWVLTPEGEAYAGFVFDDAGVFCEDLNGLYYLDSDIYYIQDGALLEEAGLVYVDGYYYFFPGESYAVKNTGYWVYKTNGILPEGLYYFDNQGHMIDPPEIYHTVTWVVDGEIVTESYRSGAFPVYHQGEIPQKAASEEYSYSFTGWEPECSIAICDTTYRAVFAAIPHSYVTETEAPACTEDGCETILCEDCGYILRQSLLSATGHRYVSRVVPPACTSGGYREHVCEACGDCYRTNYSAPTGHINLYTIEVPATCTQKGSITYVCCCGEVRKVRPIKAKGHCYSYENLGDTHRACCDRNCGSCYEAEHSYTDGVCACGALQPVSVNSADRVILPGRKKLCTEISPVIRLPLPVKRQIIKE